MNDLEHEIRETLRHHEDEAPTFDSSDALHAAARTRRRQIVNVAGVGLGTLVVVIGLVAGLGELVRADRSPTVIDRPTPSPTMSPEEVMGVNGWPGRTVNGAGVYSWNGTPFPEFPNQTLGFIHNGHAPSSGAVFIAIRGVPGRLVPHRGQASTTVADHESTHRRFTSGKGPWWFSTGGPGEAWMVDINGTTVTILLIAKPRAPKGEVAEAREIIESISVDPEDNELGFRLIFTIPSAFWDSG